MGVYEDLQRLAGMVRGFMASRVILSAHQTGLFVSLKKPSTSRAVARHLSLEHRATEVVLDALTGLGLLRKQKGRYALSPVAKKFFLPESPYYMGNAFAHMDNLWQSWSHLTSILKNGGPAPRDSFDHETFILAMEDIARWKVREVIKHIDLKGIKKALDLGGGPGTYARALARRGIHVTLFDREETLPVAKKLAERDSLADRINFRAGDFLTEPIGTGYDMVLVSQVLHSYGPRDCVRLLKKIKKALRPDGVVVVHEFFVKKDRSGPPSGVLFGVNMLVNTPEGRVYPVEEIKAMLKKATFKKASVHHLQDTVLVVARA